MMAIEPFPTIGDWYRHSAGDFFENVAQDDEDDTLEPQYYDSIVEELGMDVWEFMRPQLIEPSENWATSMDLAREDEQDFEIWSETDDWLSALDRLDESRS